MPNFQLIRKPLMIILGMAIVWLTVYYIETSQDNNQISSTYLAKPFSNKMILITSAGQSTDTYILQDLANELRFNNLFMPEAYPSDLSDVTSIVVVVGYSDIGLALHDKSIEDESQRVKALLDEADKLSLPLIVVYVGGKARRNEETDMLLSLTCNQASFIITTTEGNHDQFLTDIARENSIPISYINSTTDLTMPLAAAFR